MTLPSNFDLNMLATGFVPNMNAVTGMTAPDSLSFFNMGGLMPQMDPIDSFCSNIMSDFTRMQNQYFSALMQILNNPSINHTPAPFVADYIRPYDYNSYGKNGEMISKLAPEMQEKTMQLLDYAKSQNLNVSIISGYRTQDEQKHLQKTRPQFAAKNSPHCVGKAIDIKITNGNDDDYKKLGDYAKSIGMRWGGDFKNPAPENWHFDYGWR